MIEDIKSVLTEWMNEWLNECNIEEDGRRNVPSLNLLEIKISA